MDDDFNLVPEALCGAGSDMVREITASRRSDLDAGGRSGVRALRELAEKPRFAAA